MNTFYAGFESSSPTEEASLLSRTSTIMKCFEHLVKTFITFPLPDSLDPLQFAYRSNISTVDTIIIALHTALSSWTRRTHM